MTTTAPTRTPNIDLLERTMAYIEAHPDEHNQGHWARKYLTTPEAIRTQERLELPVPACGTAFCFAGHAVNLTIGVEFDSLTQIGAYVGGSKTTDGRYIEDAAREDLGLTYDQAGALFRYDNTIEDLRVMVDQIKVDPTAFDYSNDEEY